MAGLDRAIPIIVHGVASWMHAATLCPRKRDRRVKPDDGL
jgi:hypothetical protein